MQEIHVVGAAIRDGNKVLAAQRSEKMNAPLKWEFAGGKVEPGETHQQALERELLEELGIRIKVKDYLATGSAQMKGKRVLLHVYEAELVGGTPVLKEHAQVRWIDLEHILELEWAEPDIPACKELLKRYGRKC